MNKYCAKFKYKGMKTVGSFRLHKPDTPYAFRMENNVFVQHQLKYLSNVHKIEGAHFQCVNNHYVKFEFKGMKTI